MNLEKILLLRPDMIGDCVLITPAITLLRKKHPNARIAVLASPYTRAIFANNPDVDEIITDKKIPENKFDISIHFYNEFEYALMAKRAKIPVRIGSSNKPLIGWLYTKRIDQKWTDLTLHEVEHNLLLLKALDVDISNPPPLNIGIQRTKSKDFTVGIHLGTGKGNRSWLPERYAEVADYLIKKLHAKVILTGSKKEIGLAEHVPGENLVGKTTLAELIKTIATYDIYIGVDTGPMHIAAALKVPTVAIFPTKFVKPSEWGPWQTQHIVVRKKINCRRSCLPKKCELDDCLLQIKAQDVIDAVELLLKGKTHTKDDWIRMNKNE